MRISSTPSRRIRIILIFLCTIFPFIRILAQTSEPNRLQELYDRVLNLGIDLDRMANVNNLTIVRDTGELFLESGTLALLENHDGLQTGAVFYGNGRFTFTPNSRVEKEHLKRLTGSSYFSEDIEGCYFRFTDSTANEIQKKVAFQKREVPKDMHSIKRWGKYFTTHKVNTDVIMRLLRDILNKQEGGFFYLQLNPKNDEPYFFIIDPEATEEVQFHARAFTSTFARQVYSSYHLLSEYEMEINDHEPRYAISPKRYDIVADLNSRGKLDVVATLKLTFNRRSSSLLFSLSEMAKVDSVILSRGGSLDFIKRKEDNELLVMLDRNFDPGEEAIISFYYSGQLLNRTSKGAFGLQNTINWYPIHDIYQRSIYRLYYRYPKPFSLISIGAEVARDTVGKDIHSEWSTDQPVRFASFSFGNYKQYDLERKGDLPQIRVYMGKEHVGFLRGNMIENVAEDISGSLSLFRELFGVFPYENLNVTEIPFSHGQSFPGLIHLSWDTFQSQSGEERGYPQAFRAHEVAHQWFGHNVSWETYHDQWLSEGVASYAGLMYVQQVMGGDKEFLEILDIWRKSIIERRKYLFKSGLKPGPIWLGMRNSTSKTVGDFTVITYQKGGYLLHMLRYLMRDLESGSDRKFKEMLKTFSLKYAGKSVNTSDFKRWAERFVGYDLTWFFDQWVYGVDTPEYIYDWTIENSRQGGELMTIHVSQSGVPEGFRSYVPLEITFNDDSKSAYRVLIDELEEEFSFYTKKKVKEVEFNAWNAVLANVERR